MPDKFPEAFERFANSVNLEQNKPKTINELNMMFFQWGKDKAPLTNKQRKAIRKEAVKRGIMYRRERYNYKNRSGYYYKWRNARTGRFIKQPEFD